MQNFLRKHKRAVGLFVAAFIGVPMVLFFGVPRSQPRDEQGYDDEVIATVGEVPVKASEFRRNLEGAAQMQARQRGERPSYEELDADGTAERVLEQMIDSALITLQEQQREFDVEQSLLEERMHEWPQFQDDEGNFDPNAWNAWIEENPKQDWMQLYEDLERRLSRQVYLNAMLAPSGRVFGEPIEEQLERDHSKLAVKYAKIEPKVELTDEAIRAHYDENTDEYKSPDQRVAELVTVSLKADIPEQAYEIVKQAREGADFASLAAEFSDVDESGGDIGWQSPGEDMDPHREALFELEVGKVSDPLPGPGNGFFIYKVEEERTNEETGKREVRARRIMLQKPLSDEERARREALAEEIIEKAKGAENFADVAAAYDRELIRTDLFSKESRRIENVPRSDTYRLATQFTSEGPDDYQSVTAVRNIYIGHAVDLIPGEIQPFEDVKEDVREDAIEAHKETDEYKERVDAAAEKVVAQGVSLDEAKEQFPELDIKVETPSEIALGEKRFMPNIYLPTEEIYNEIENVEPGTVVGPFSNFRDEVFLIELVSLTPPTEEELAELEEERKELREQAQQKAERELLQDFLDDLRERSMRTVNISLNQEEIDEILGRTPAPEPDTEATTEEEPTDEDTDSEDETSDTADTTEDAEDKTEDAAATTEEADTETAEPATEEEPTEAAEEQTEPANEDAGTETTEEAAAPVDSES